MPESSSSGGNRATNRRPLATLLATLLALLAFLAFQKRPARGRSAAPILARPAPNRRGREPRAGQTDVQDAGQKFQGAPATAHRAPATVARQPAATSNCWPKTSATRNVVRHRQLVAAAAAIDKSFTAAGCKLERQTMQVRGRSCDNLQAEILGTDRPKEIVVVGAHYIR